MNDCLRQFILSLNQLQVTNTEIMSNKKFNQYLKRLDKEWKTGSNERQQYEEAFLKIVTSQNEQES